MEIIILFIGITLSFISSINLIKKLILNKGFIIKRVKVIGFEAYTYLIHGIECNTIYNTNVYPIIEVKDENKVIKIAILLFGNENKLKKGDVIDVIYPKGNLEKIKIYNYNDIYNFYYLAFIMGLLIATLSFIII